MKNLLILLLALTLSLSLCACGEDETTDDTAATRSSAVTTASETTVAEAATTTASETSTTGSSESDVSTTASTATTVTTTAPTTTTTAAKTTTITKATTTTTKTTTTTAAAAQPIDPSNLVTYREYWGNDYRISGTMLSFTALQFEDGYCVVTDRQFTADPAEGGSLTLTHEGKTYYSVGGGFDPTLYTVSGNTIVVRDMNTEAETAVLALYEGGIIKILSTDGNHIDAGIEFVLSPQ